MVVNCAGQWAKALADQVGVTVPLHSAEHFYVVTDQIEGVAPGPADPARPRRLDLLQGGGRRPGGRRLRARGEAVAVAGHDPAPVRVPAARRGLGALLDADGRGGAPDPGARRDRDPQVLQRPGVVHARQPVRDGRGAGAARLLRRRRLQLGRHRLGRRRRPGAGRVDRRGRADRPTWWPSTSAGSRRSTATTAGCGTGSWRCSGCTTRCRGRTASWRPRVRSGARPLHDRLAAPARRSARRWAGSGRTSSRPRASRRSSHYSWGRPPWLPWSAAEQRATREAVAVFDQTSFSKYVVDGPGALEALQWVCANDVDADVGQAVYTPLLNARGAYESDLTVTRVGGAGVPAGQQLRDHGARPGLDPPARPGRLRRPGARRDHGVRRARGDGSALARTCSRGSPTRDLGEEAFPFATSREHLAGLRHGAGHPDDVRRRARLGADGAGRVRGRRVRRAARRGASEGSRTRATTRSSRCGWRRATARSGAS